MASTQHCILLAHGSRDRHWCETFERGIASIEIQLNQRASLAFMELATPSLEQVIEREYALGTRHFNIIPLFLAAGKHLLVDVPNQLDAIKAQLNDCSFTLHEPLGKEPDFWHFLTTMINKQL